MGRPEVEKYEAMADKATAGPWKWVRHGGWDVLVGPQRGDVVLDDGSAHGEYPPSIYVDSPDGQLIATARTAIPELCAYAKYLESILRDWLAACPETCGQCDGVRKRAEEAVR